LTNKLKQALAGIAADSELKADVEIYLKAGEWALRFPEEFYKPEYVGFVERALTIGLQRAAELQAGSAPWERRKGRLCRGYRSRVDGSVQPYALVIPESYTAARPHRLDVILHGRAATMTEASFLAAHETPKPAPDEQDYIQLEVYGRGNNAYRWAGETDVFEAIASVRRRYNIDPQRIVLRGFSMGGAGAWHLGLHYPHRWAAVEAGAGFTETLKYARLGNLPDYQRATLSIYDAYLYALNAVNVPVVGYGGELDPQLQASVNIQEQLRQEGLALSSLRALFLVGPKTEHRWHPDSKLQSEAFIRKVIQERRPLEEQVRFVTYTARYGEVEWARIEGLERHYERAELQARRSGDRVEATTKNIFRLSFDRPVRLRVDGQELPMGRSFERRNARWKVAQNPSSVLRKRPGLQGPIDDAFMDSFLCVPPKGGDKRLAQFAAEFAKWLRGDVRVRQPEQVTQQDVQEHHLILFGTPETNSLIRRIHKSLPLHWEGKQILAGRRRFSAAEHTLILIYPNPLNPKRYVVLNSGHTFGEREFRGTNALLFPRLGDYAVVRSADSEVVFAGLFDDNWSLPK
jgi:dienelactone hydrolase